MTSQPESAPPQTPIVDTPGSDPAAATNGSGRHTQTPLDMRPPMRGLDAPMTRARRDRARLRRASWAFTTRRVPPGAVARILPAEGQPEAGDLVLARVDAIGHHPALQMINGRRRQLFPDTEIVVAFGHRYASNQFESVVPQTMGPCHLVAGGGIASRARSWHDKVSRGPTQITPLGFLGDASGRRLNLADFALPPARIRKEFQPVPIVVFGTSMDAGKTQTCVHLVRGLTAGGSRVGYAKITGTGSGGDYWWLRDAGAEPVLDFTDLGHASTYMLGEQEVEQVLDDLIDQVAQEGVDAMVLEIADGVLQRETAALLRGEVFNRRAGGVVLAAADSMGACAGYHALRSSSVPTLALSGVLTAAPLQVEEASAATGLPAYNREDLASPGIAMGLLGLAQKHLAGPRDHGGGTEGEDRS